MKGEAVPLKGKESNSGSIFDIVKNIVYDSKYCDIW